MNHVLQIAANVFWIAVIGGFVVWLFTYSFKRSDNPSGLVLRWLLTIPLIVFYVMAIMPLVRRGGYGAIAGILLAVVFGNVMLMIWRNSIIDIVANPIGGLYDGGKLQVVPKPQYSVALSKRKLNRPLEAIVEIRQQLAKFPDDYEGVMLLANIQAEDTKDIPSAEITLNHFCNRPEAPPNQVAAALTQLADWHLKLAQDTGSARAVLERIAERFPKTNLALQAAQRIAHLGGTANILLAAHDRQAMPVPEGVNNIGLLDSTAFLQPQEKDPAQQAAELVKHLEEYPVDTEAREKLAIIYARHYHRLDLATLELAQLVNEPNQPPKRVAHWLNLLADLQISNGADYDTVRETLEKIAEHFPASPMADVAQSRLGRLKLEIKGQQKTPSIKLGVYEQNIGLKYGSPRQL